MTTKKSETKKDEPQVEVLPVGSLWQVPNPARITRPNGSLADVVGGVYVLSEVGEHAEASGLKVIAE